MSSSTNNNLIAKLKGRENFDEWKISAQSYLVIKGLWKNISTAPSENATADQLEADLKAKSELTLLIDPQNYSYIADKTTAKSAWESLVDAFEDSGICRKVSLLQQLVSMKLKNCSSMESYVNQMLLLSIKVKKAGFVIGEDIIASLILGGLTANYRPMIMGIENSGKALTVDFVKNILLQEISSDASENAFFAKKKFNKQRKCFECNELNHIARFCPNREANKKSDNDINSKNDSSKASRAFIASFFVNEQHSKDWYFDSGSTSHLTHDVAILENAFQSVKKEVITANKDVMFVESVGDVNETILLNNEPETLRIKNVQYVPNVIANLISVSKIVESVNSVLFHNRGCEVFNADKEVIATGSLINGMFKLDVLRNPDNIVCAVKEADDKVLLWHRRLGHLNYRSMCEMRDGSVIGVSFKNNSNVLKNCEICAKGKHARRSFKSSMNHSANLLDMIHADLCGPMEETSIGGAKYFLTFIDDFSHKVFIYFLTSKTEVLSKFIEFKNWAENQVERRIKIFRTDNGTEFCQEKVKNICIESGIQHQRTVVYTPQQNGVAERMNRTIVERARCLIFDADLDKSFWAEASNMAVFLINRSTCSFLVDTTPEEVWTGNKVDLTKLKVFGSPVMAHVPKPHRKKWDAKSIKLIFVGYDNDKKGIRCIDPSTKKLIVSTDVIFMEGASQVNVSNFDDDKYRFFPEFDEDNDMTEPQLQQELGPDLGPEPEDSPNVSIVDLTSLNSTMVDLNASSSSSDDSQIYTDASMLDNTHDSRVDPTYTTRANVRDILLDGPSSRTRYRTFDLNNHFAIFSFITSDPLTLQEALANEHGDKWQQAIRDEYDSLMKNDTWILTDLPIGKKAIKNKWVFKTKTDNMGNITRHKARLVAKGCSQKPGIDYKETYSPVVRYCSIRYLISVAAQYNLDIHQMDVETAFLQGDLHDEIYMTQPEAYSDGSSKVCKLNKPIYGLKQASREWNMKLSAALNNANYKRSNLDPCIYYRMNENLMIFLAIYVDDLMIFCNDSKMRNELKTTLMKQFKMKDIGLSSYCIGLHISRDNNGIYIDQ